MEYISLTSFRPWAAASECPWFAQGPEIIPRKSGISAFLFFCSGQVAVFLFALWVVGELHSSFPRPVPAGRRTLGAVATPAR